MRKVRPGDLVAVDATKVFLSTSTFVGMCPCGCGCVKLALCDERGDIRAIASYALDEAIECARHLSRTALEAAPVSGRPA